MLQAATWVTDVGWIWPAAVALIQPLAWEHIYIYALCVCMCVCVCVYICVALKRKIKTKRQDEVIRWALIQYNCSPYHKRRNTFAHKGRMPLEARGRAWSSAAVILGMPRIVCKQSEGRKRHSNLSLWRFRREHDPDNILLSDF